MTNSLINSDGPAQFGPYSANPFGTGPALTAPIARNDLLSGSGLTNASCRHVLGPRQQPRDELARSTSPRPARTTRRRLGLDPAGLQLNGGLIAPTDALCTGAGTPAGCAGPSPAIGAGSTFDLQLGDRPRDRRARACRDRPPGATPARSSPTPRRARRRCRRSSRPTSRPRCHQARARCSPAPG